MIGLTRTQRFVVDGLNSQDPYRRGLFERPTLRTMRKTYLSLERKGVVIMVGGSYRLMPNWRRTHTNGTQVHPRD